MSVVAELENRTRQQVLCFFQDSLGYRYLGDWKGREGNRNAKLARLRGWLPRPCQCNKIGLIKAGMMQQLLTGWVRLVAPELAA